MGSKSVRITTIKSISVQFIGVLILISLFRFGIGVDYSVATSLLEPHALLLAHKEAQRGVKVSPPLYSLNDIGLDRHVLSCSLKPSLMSVSLEALAETKPIGK